MKKILFIIAITIASLSAAAEIPKGYYPDSELKGKNKSELKTALYNIIRNQSQQQTYNGLPTFFRRTDVYPNSSRWWDMYSDIPLYAPSFSGLNREHSLPKSWWNGLTNVLAYTDLNHLYPSEMDANSAKSNYPLGEVTDGGSRFNNSVVMVGKARNMGGAAYAFEPADEYKGDFARTYFYMVTCYQDFTWKYTYMCRNGAYPSLQQWAIDMLLKWHRQDPVSEKEINRNDQVYLIQANRNPFIDYPDLVEYIWGDKMDQTYPGTGGSTQPAAQANLITPPNKMALDFNQIAVGHTATATLQFRGEKFTGPISLTVAGTNKSYFSISQTAISASAVNAPSGTWITVSYTPTSTGSHTARLIVNFNGQVPDEPGGRVVNLIGQSLPVPTLSALTANSATEVTDSSFRANWDAAPQDEDIDYYILTLRRYDTDGNVTTEELPAENNFLDITDAAGLAQATYSVQSVRLGIRSQASNTITVAIPSEITGILPDQPLVIQSFPGFIRFTCSQTHTAIRIFDITGRLIVLLPQVSDGFELSLVPGTYIIVSDQHPRPIKTITR